MRISGDRWSGRIHRNGFDSTTILTRPGASAGKSKPWFVGTWKTGSPQFQNCLHIMEQAPGEFIGWSDSLNTLGSARCPSRLPKPAYSYEVYGHLVNVATTDNSNVATDKSNVSIELNALGIMCCPHPFVATSENNGTVMKEVSPKGPNQLPLKTVWKKMSGNTCIVAPPDPAPRPENLECPCPTK
jgi:hypothetical protein